MVKGARFGRITAALAALILSGCVVGPNYHAPDAPPANALGRPPGDLAGAGPDDPAQRLTPGLAPAEWWRVFGSDEINARVAEALSANPDVAAARATLAQAREAAIRAGTGGYPAVDLTTSVTRLTTSFLPQGIDQRGSLTNDYLIGPSVTFPLDVFGGQRRLRENRQAEAEAAGFELQAARLAVSGAVVRAAIEAARLRAQLDTWEGIVASDRELAAGIEGLVSLRRRTVADLAVAQSRLARHEAEAAPLRQQLVAVETALAVLTGRTPGEAPRSALRLAALRVAAEVPVSLPAELVRGRPDVRASEAQLRAANAAIGIAAARRLPSLALNGSITQEALSASRLFDSAATGGFLTASLTTPLVHAGALRSQQREAQAGYDLAAAHYRKAVLAAVGQTADVLRALDNDASAVAAEGAAVAAAEHAVQAAEAQYHVGRVDILAVLTARQELGEARLRQAAVRAQRLLDIAQLYVALGGGVTDPAAAPRPS
jgi:NodT family efflux transporter outer membrane factor (OMF) lipoprotein